MPNSSKPELRELVYKGTATKTERHKKRGIDSNQINIRQDLQDQQDRGAFGPRVVYRWW